MSQIDGFILDDNEAITQEGESNTKLVSLDEHAQRESLHDDNSIDDFDEMTAANDFFKDL